MNSVTMNAAIHSIFPDPTRASELLAGCCFGEGVISEDAFAILKSFQRDTINALADCMVTCAAELEAKNLRVTPEELKRQAQMLRDYADTLVPAAPEAMR